MLMLKNDYRLAKLCCLKSIELTPGDKEAYVNMNNIMRQMGQKEECFEFCWSKIEDSVKDEGKVSFVKPRALDCLKVKKLNVNPFAAPLCIVCVKYGTKYGADYVNKLYWGIKENITIQFTFVCFTDNAEGLDEEIKPVSLTDHQWSGWWSKVNIFNGEKYKDFFVGKGKSVLVFYIDLDMIISGKIDELIMAYRGNFVTLSTNDIFCEQTQDGYNSSVMIFAVENKGGRYISQVQILYETLTKYYDHVIKYLMRFDHYLEMLIWNADILQELVPG